MATKKKKKSTPSKYLVGLHWCCTSCGYMFVGGQPEMECAICDAYKTAFVDIPQHIESALLEKYGEGDTNTEEARRERFQIATEGGHFRNFRFQGRALKIVYAPTASRKTL